MSKLFIRTLFLTMFIVIILTACGTSAPASNLAPTYAPAAFGTSSASGSVSFTKDILPIFQNTCVSCHGGDKTEKGLDLKTYASAMAGSQRGAVIVVGDAGNSLLFMSVASGKMPKRGDKLTSEQIQLIMNWINAGAQDN